jgi:hypothetical protein
MTAPLEPDTDCVRVALKRSPTLLVLVQIFVPDARLSVEPAAMVPTLPADPRVLVVTVLPLAVVPVVVRGRVVVVVLAGVVVRGADVLGAGVVSAGTSVSAGCAALSRFAS